MIGGSGIGTDAVLDNAHLMRLAGRSAVVGSVRKGIAYRTPPDLTCGVVPAQLVTFTIRWRPIFGAIWPVCLMRGRSCVTTRDSWLFPELLGVGRDHEVIRTGGTAGTSSKFDRDAD
jgi:hypothetical protein